MIVDEGGGKFRLTIRVPGELLKYLESEDYRCTFEDAIGRELLADLRALRSRITVVDGQPRLLPEFYRRP